ncbi:MAG: GNAT family N-acetyltransferase [Candidatus Dormibacteria bacterium]
MSGTVRSGVMATGLPWRIRPTSAEDAAAIVVLRDLVAVEPDRICADPGERGVAEESLALAGVLSEGGISLTLEVGGDFAGHLLCQRHVGRHEAHVAEFAIVVSADHRGAGLGRALIDAAIDWCGQCGITKLELSVFPANTPAIALYRSMGFVEEGNLRAHMRVGGEARDLMVMGRLL